MATSDLDSRVRAAAFELLEEQTRLHGEVLARGILSRGFTFDGTRVPLVGRCESLPITVPCHSFRSVLEGSLG